MVLAVGLIVTTTPSGNVIAGSVKGVSNLATITLGEKVTLVPGDTYTAYGIGTLLGQDLTVKLVSVVATGPGASSYMGRFDLLNAQGDVLNTQTISPGELLQFEDFSGNAVVAGKVYLMDATVDPSTNDSIVRLGFGDKKIFLNLGDTFLVSGDAYSGASNLPLKVKLAVVIGPSADNFEFQLLTMHGDLIDTQHVKKGDFIQFVNAFGDPVVSQMIRVDK